MSAVARNEHFVFRNKSCHFSFKLITTLVFEGNNFRFELYGQTHHAFDNPEAGTDPTARLVYSPHSAARAKVAIAEFISEQLKMSGSLAARDRG